MQTLFDVNFLFEKGFFLEKKGRPKEAAGPESLYVMSTKEQ